MALQSLEVTFNNPIYKLSGSLYLPNTDPPHPAVVFVMGSGPAARDGYGSLPPLWEEFTGQGFACLAWDKPGVGGSEGDWRTQSTRDRALETLSAVRFLAKHPSISPEKIGLWGISQAGWVMPLTYVLAEEGEIAFMISVSGPGGTAEQQELFRVRHQLAADGYSPVEVESAVRFSERRFALMRQDAPFEACDALQQTVQGQVWLEEVGNFSAADYDFIKLRAMQDRSPEADLEQVRCPVLAVYGELDTIVDTAQSIEVYKRALARAGNSRPTIKVFPNADHLIFPSTTGGGKELNASFSKDPKVFVEGYLEMMGRWLEEVVS